MSNIPVIAFSAFSGTGKTTIIEKLVASFKTDGLRVAVIKHDGHDFDIDREGKDSWRFTKAGADISLISSHRKTAFIESRPMSIESLIELAHDVDIILVEGYKNLDLPKIGIARKATGKGFTAPVDSFIAIVTDIDDIDYEPPCFEPEDIEGLKNFIMNNMKDFTHFNEEGRAKMVDVGSKPESRRTAIAAGRVLINEETFELIRSGGLKKGDVLTVAQIAGIMGAKKTAELIPMCHPVAVDGIDMKLSLNRERCCVEIEAAVSCDGRTGVEMEALTAVSAAALTVYDMCKAVQKDILISDIRLISKTGGIHGDFCRKDG